MRSVDGRHALPRAGNPEKGFPMLTSSVVPDRTRIVAGEESLIPDRRAGLYWSYSSFSVHFYSCGPAHAS